MRICRPDSDGLSPRVRGNLISRRSHTAEYRSIPASAGEPARELFQKQGAAVYPRECGGTFHLGFHVPLGTGLSPRVRGNRACPSDHVAASGSIPASAGEPPSVIRVGSRLSVYPRECGGTDCWASLLGQKVGLSPRVRGNRNCRHWSLQRKRSIPASAGEPRMFTPMDRAPRVYPRECGGTKSDLVANTGYDGLSPRVRGNPGAVLEDAASMRSIPASAGEPFSMASKTTRNWVYPRECGGTCRWPREPC